ARPTLRLKVADYLAGARHLDLTHIKAARAYDEALIVDQDLLLGNREVRARGRTRCLCRTSARCCGRSIRSSRCRSGCCGLVLFKPVHEQDDKDDEACDRKQ